MKVRVYRSLQGGIYTVAFAFSDFTQEELAKMKSFGVPSIQVRIGLTGRDQTAIAMAINQVTPNHIASFLSEPDARNYEAAILTQAKAGMDALRQRKDDFTSSSEVEI